MSRSTRRDFLKTVGGAAALSAASARGAGAQRLSATASRPNILFFFPDQHRWDWTPLNPEVPVPMPNLEALAARGTAFDRAYCAAPVCAPSRACLAMGREYDDCGVPNMRVDFPRERTTVYERLRDGGYTVLGCGKMDLAAGSMRAVIEGSDGPANIGLDGRRFTSQWGFSDAVNNAGKGAGAFLYNSEPVGPKDAYYAYLDQLDPSMGQVCAEDMLGRRQPTRDAQWADVHPSPLAEEQYCDNWIARNGLALLDSVPQGEPWFLMVNFAGPHPPMDIPKRLERLYRGPERVIDDYPQPHRYKGPWDEARHVAIRQNYSAMIENIDRWLGIYLEKLEERGELESTVIVYSSDHGEMLGDHSRWGKVVPFEPSVGVPLVLAGPGIRPGARSDAMVSLIDLSATFLDLAALETPPEMDGFSLRDLLAGRTTVHREYLLSGLYDWRMVFDGRYKLVTDFEGAARRLYDLREDPWEDVDLAARHPERCRELSELLRQGSYRA